MQQKKSLLILVLSALFLTGCATPAASSSGAASSTAASSSAKTSSTAKSSSSSKSSTAASSSSEEPDNGLNVFYNDGNFAFGSAAALYAGQMAYWAGEGGSVTSASVANGVYTLSYNNDGAWQFYSVQIFYKLPYAVAGDAYRFHATIHSDVAGAITINGSQMNLVAGDNACNLAFTQGDNETLSIQLGVYDKDTAASTLLQGYLFQLSNIRITDAVNTYHEVKFVDGETTLKDLQVRDGKTVSAPKDPTPATGKVFEGWYNEATKWTSALAITTPMTFSAKYVDVSSAHQVKFYSGTTLLGSTNIVDGQPAVLPSDLVYPFGYGPGKWYSDSALTKEFDFTSAITADTSIYAKLYVKPVSTCSANKANWGAIPSKYVSTDAQGGWVLSGYAGDAASGNWFTQINFGPVPTATSGSYKIDFTYSINATGGQISVYDDTNKGDVVSPIDLESGTDKTASVTYGAADTSGNARVQFGLGLIAADATISFTIAAVKVTYTA